MGCVWWLLASHGAKHSPPESSELPPPRNRNSQNESSFSAVFRPQRQNHGSFRNVCVFKNSLASSWCPGFLRRARGTPGEEVWRRKKSATMVAHAADAGHGCGRCPGALGCVRWLLASHGAKHSPPESRSHRRRFAIIYGLSCHFLVLFGFPVLFQRLGLRTGFQTHQLDLPRRFGHQPRSREPTGTAGISDAKSAK